MDDDKLRGKHLAYLRRKRGLKQIDLADLLHYTDKNISKWENGKSFPTEPDILYSLANVLDVSVDELICGYKKDNELSHKSFYKIFKNYLLKYKNIFVIILCSILLNYIFLIYFCDNYYAVVKSDNIKKSYINVKLDKDKNIFEFDKLKTFNKNIRFIYFYYKSNNNDYLLFAVENQNLSLSEKINSLEYDFQNVVNSSCYLKIVYKDKTFDIINIKFKKII